RATRRSAGGLSLARASLRLLVEHLADRGEHRVVGGELAAVGEVEAIVEVGGVPSLRVLQDGLELVERLGELCLGRLRSLVLVPEARDLFSQARGQRREKLEEVAPLVGGLAGGAARLLRGGHVAADRFAEVVDDADLDEAREVDTGEAWMQHERHQAQAPSVLGHALLLSRRCPSASPRGLQALCRAEKGDDIRQRGFVHIKPRTGARRWTSSYLMESSF